MLDAETYEFIFAMTTRRQFLFGCSALTLAASFAPASLWSAPPSRNVSLDQISFETLAAQVGTVFTISQKSAATAALKLVEAKLTPSVYPVAQHAEDAKNEKFFLMFCGPKHPALTQDTHIFEHADLGRFQMFIVPVRTKDSRRTYYQAIFNRPVAQALV
jgi:hypothetical protein